PADDGAAQESPRAVQGQRTAGVHQDAGEVDGGAGAVDNPQAGDGESAAQVERRAGVRGDGACIAPGALQVSCGPGRDLDGAGVGPANGRACTPASGWGQAGGGGVSE